MSTSNSIQGSGSDSTEEYIFLQLNLPQDRHGINLGDLRKVVMDLTIYGGDITIEPINDRVIVHEGNPLYRRINTDLYPGPGDPWPIMRCTLEPAQSKSIVSLQSEQRDSDGVFLDQTVVIIVEPDEGGNG